MGCAAGAGALLVCAPCLPTQPGMHQSLQCKAGQQKAGQLSASPLLHMQAAQQLLLSCIASRQLLMSACAELPAVGTLRHSEMLELDSSALRAPTGLNYGLTLAFCPDHHASCKTDRHTDRKGGSRQRRAGQRFELPQKQASP